MSNWRHIQHFYQHLLQDVYVEPFSEHHARAALDAYDTFCGDLSITSMVEFGCGTAPMLQYAHELGVKTLGVTLLEEDTGEVPVLRADMHFTELENGSFDLVAARHVMEHSPMPLMLLMEMWRISRSYALIVVPAYSERAAVTWKNHYSVLTDVMWEKLFSDAQWDIKKKETVAYFEYEPGKWDEEYRWLLEKQPRV